MTPKADATTHEIPYPFVRGTYSGYDECEDGISTIVRETWNPGAHEGCDDWGRLFATADAMGAMLLTEVAHFASERGRPMVVVRIKWREPEGRVFGKGQLKILSRDKFQRTLRGYRGGTVAVWIDADAKSQGVNHDTKD